jgi:hypothetical protein
MRATDGLNAALLLEFQQGIVCVRAGLQHKRFEFAGIEPEAVTVVAEIDLDILEVQDEERDIAFWANSDHGGSVTELDGSVIYKSTVSL